jgi:uncharacterized membrane protein YuzA (DUF378 family)
MRGMSILSKTGLIAAVVGSVSWLIVGIWQYHFVADIFGSGTLKATTGARIVYIVFGAGAIICLPLLAAALSSATAGRRSIGQDERTRYDDLTPRETTAASMAPVAESQQAIEGQEYREFQAWRAGKRAQEASAGAEQAERRVA